MSKPLKYIISLIFTTKNDELAIFGQTLDDVKRKLIDFNNITMQGGVISSSKMQLIPESKIIQELTSLQSKEIVNVLNSIKDGTDSTFSSMDDYLTWLGGKGKGYISDYVAENQNQIYTTEGVIAASKAARDAQIAHNLTIKQSTIAYKAATLAKRMFSMAGNILVMMALSKAIEVVSKTINELVHSEENLQNKASELGSTVQKNAADIDSYKNNIKDLHAIINDSSSSIEDVTKARSDLMVVQDELIDKFGDEKGAIETITTAINGQSDALDNLSKKSYLSAKNKFNEKTSGDKFSAWLSFGSTDDDRIQSNMDKMVSKMRNSMYELQTTGNEVLDNLIAKSYGLNISADMYGDGSHFNIYGDLDEIQDKLYGIQEMSSDFDVSTGFENSLTGISNDVDTAIQSYKDLYDQYVLYEKVLNSSKDNQYDEQFDAINKAKEAYDKAFSSGDDSAIQKASQDYANVLSGAMNLATENYDEEVADYFRSMYPELQEIVSAWEFSADFKLNTGGIIGQTTDASGKFNNSEEILNFNAATATQEQIDAFGTLNNVAGQYNMTLTQMIGLLEKEGVVESENRRQLEDKFGKTNVSLLSDADLQIAYEVSDGTIQSWDELIAKIEGYKASLKEDVEPPVSTAEALSQIQALSKGLDQLDKIYADVYDKEEFDWSSILNNEDFEETFGEMGSAYDEFIQVITDNPDNIDACQSAFDKLATAYIYNSDALKNVTAETKEATIAMLEQMGISNAEEIVTRTLALQANYLAIQKQYLAAEGRDLTNATWEEISAFLSEAEYSDEAKRSLAELMLAKETCNGTVLSFSSDLDNIIAYVETLDGTTKSLAALNAVKNGQAGVGSKEDYEALIRNAQKEIQNALNGANDAKNSNNTKFNGSNPPDSPKGNPSGSAKPSNTETAQTFDWIERKLEVLNDKTSDLGDSFSKALTASSAENSYKQYLSAIGEEIDANNTAISYYQQKLNEVGLAYEWIAKIQAGAIDVSSITDQNLISQINEYQSYYDKVQSSYDNIKRLEEQRLKAQVDYANKVIDQYEKEIKQSDKLMNMYKALVNLKETFGLIASRDDLRNEQYVAATQIEMLEEQNNQMWQLLTTTTYMSEAWQTYYDKIEENKASIKELTQSLADLAMEMANLPIEKYNKYIDKNSEKNELYSAKLDNSGSVKTSNKLIDKQIKIATKNDNKAQSTAKETAKNLQWASGQNFKDAWDMDYGKAVFYGQTAQAEQIKDYYNQIQKYVKAGKQVPASLISALSDGNYASLIYAVNNYNASLIANDTAQATAALSKETAKTEIANLTKAKFDNVQTNYERKQGVNTSKANVLSTKMDTVISKGYLESESWYNQLIATEKKVSSSLDKELKELQKKLNESVEDGSIKKYSDQWWEMTESINSVTESLASSKNTLQEYINQLKQVHFDNFDYLQDQISRITSEASFYIDMMSNQDLTDDDGLTDYGVTALGLHRQNYDTYLGQASKYAEEIERIQQQLNSDPYNTTLIAQMQEYQDLQKEAIKNAEGQKEAIVDLVKNGYDALIDSLGEAIKKYKELLKNAKDAHDYQNTISEKSSDITSLQKQIAAYSKMSGNEEVASKLQKLNKELASAQKDLQETMYEKYISDTQDALDDLLNELENFINELVNDFEKLFQEGIATVDNNQTVITSTLAGLSDKYGTELSSALEATWENYYNPEAGMNKIISSIDKLISAADEQADKEAYTALTGDYADTKSLENRIQFSESFTNTLKDRKNEEKKGLDAAKKKRNTAEKKYGKGSMQYVNANNDYKEALKVYNTAKSNYEKQLASLNADKSELAKITASNKSIVKDFLQAVVNPDKPSRELTALDEKVYAITGGYLSDYNKTQLSNLLSTGTSDSDMLEKLKSYGFSTGGIGTVVRASGEGGVALVRNGEGFVMPEHVDAIKELLAALPNITTYIRDVTPDYSKFNTPVNAGANVEVNVGDVILPNVTNPKEFAGNFVGVLKNDPKVQSALGTFVSTELTGGNSLNIRKF